MDYLREPVRITPKHINNNRSAVQSKKYPGYYIVPGYPDILCGRGGRIIDINTGMPYRLHLGSNNSISCAVKSINGDITSMLVHRLVALTFKKKTHPNQDMVNHIDSHRWNNRASNLEWCTTAENNAQRKIHACCITACKKTVRNRVHQHSTSLNE
jgi:hypothetical protein